jgi:hypothetical protein
VMNGNSYPKLEQGKIENERFSSMTLIHFKSGSCVLKHNHSPSYKCPTTRDGYHFRSLLDKDGPDGDAFRATFRSAKGSQKVDRTLICHLVSQETHT